MQRRPVSPFSLSFLDIMFCGFGAVVLLVLILNTDTVKARNQTFADLRGEVPEDLQVSAEYLDSDVGADAGDHLVDAQLDGLGEDEPHPGQAGRLSGQVARQSGQ